MAPYPPLVKLAVRNSDWQGTVGYCSKYIELNPSPVEERFYLGLAHLQLGEPNEAEAALDQLLADKDMTAAQPGALHLKGVILGKRGHFDQAVDVRKQLDEWKALGVIQ